MPNLIPTDQFLFYTSDKDHTNIRVFVQNETVWATQKSLSEIFDIDVSGVTKHLSNIFSSGELDENNNVQFLHIAGSTKPVKFYNLDVIISIGYRVNSYKATQFRIWATKTLKEYLIKGFAMDDDRLKQGKSLFGKDYFDELLERIREIRASERRFYQKVTDIYQLSYDYDKNSPITKQFFGHSQNKLEYVVVGMTAAEIVKARANHNLPHMGLMTYSNQKAGGKILKTDVTVAKNYLNEDEIGELNRLVNMFLDYAENLAKKGKKMAMNDWQSKLDTFLKFNEYEVLQNYGTIKKETADQLAFQELDKFRPIQDVEYISDFDRAVEEIRITGQLPKTKQEQLRKEISGFDKKLKKALAFNPKD